MVLPCFKRLVQLLADLTNGNLFLTLSMFNGLESALSLVERCLAGS